MFKIFYKLIVVLFLSAVVLSACFAAEDNDFPFASQLEEAVLGVAPAADNSYNSVSTVSEALDLLKLTKEKFAYIQENVIEDWRVEDQKKIEGILYQNLKLQNDNKKLQAEVRELKYKLAESHYQLGVAYTQGKFYGKAINAYEKAIQYNPSYAAGYYNLGLLYEYARGNSSRAVLRFEQYLTLVPRVENKAQVEKFIEILKQEQ